MKISTNRAEDVDRPIVTSNAGVGPASCELPPLSIPEAWPNKPGVGFFFDLTDPPPEPGNAIERAYATGLANLRNQGGAPVALEHFRAVVTQDIHGNYLSARLLALVLSAEVGDIASLKALCQSCLTNAQPDAYAQRAIDSSSLHFYKDADSDRGDIRVGECIDQPAITAQISLAGCLLAIGQPGEAVRALEDGVTVWEARNAAWKARAKAVAEEMSNGHSSALLGSG